MTSVSVDLVEMTSKLLIFRSNFTNKSEAESAISSLNGKSIKGRSVTVNEAKPRTDSGRGGSGGGFSRRY